MGIVAHHGVPVDVVPHMVGRGCAGVNEAELRMMCVAGGLPLPVGNIESEIPADYEMALAPMDKLDPAMHESTA